MTVQTISTNLHPAWWTLGLMCKSHPNNSVEKKISPLDNGMDGMPISGVFLGSDTGKQKRFLVFTKPPQYNLAS
jgi:hypothetical protein